MAQERKRADELYLSDDDAAQLQKYSDAYLEAEAAGDTAGMQAAHDKAEAIRANYGYSGGQYGNDYIKLEQPKSEPQTVQQVQAETPSYVTDTQNLLSSSLNNAANRDSFSYTKQEPVYQESYNQQMEDLAGRMANYGQFQFDQARPEFQDQYRGQQESLIQAMQNYGPFEYNEAMPEFQDQYRGTMEDLIGQMQNYGPFEFRDAPEYQSRYQGDIDRVAGQIEGYGPFEYQDRPEYQDQYKAQVDQALNGVLNERKFEYDVANDPLYQQYRKEYLREGQRNRQDALAQAAALTGGTASTAAIAASQQAGDYYNSKLTDKIPELQQLSYNMYLNELQNNRNKLSDAMSVSQMDYGRYQDSMDR